MNTTGISFLLGPHQSAVTNALEKMRRGNIAARIWANDFRVWKPAPDEITNRLGWLHAPVDTSANISGVCASLEPFTHGNIAEIVLLGMGGSSLSAEVFNKMFGSTPGYPHLQILDTTDPTAIRNVAEKIVWNKTLFLVSSKSGSTLEITSLFRYFYNLAVSTPDVTANEHFIFITDEGSPMLAQAWELNLPYVFSNNPNIGGRYSALSLAGMIPAALIGVDVTRLLKNAAAVASQEKADFFSGKRDSNGFLLGAALGTLAQYGRDKLTVFLPPRWVAFGDWLEQLIAESTGKEGKGILPVLNEPPMDAASYGKDRVFVFFHDDEQDWTSAIAPLAAASHPILKIRIGEDYDLGGQMFLWEMATAVASHILGINPFDQPDVEATKKHTRRMIDEYMDTKVWPLEKPVLTTKDAEIYGKTSGTTTSEALIGFLSSSTANDYAGLLVYLSRSPQIDAALETLQNRICKKYGLAVTIGYGPRYLHSTGQLHKGDAARGLFILLTGNITDDIDIPDTLGKPGSSLTFGALKAAQAEADRQALLDKGRRVLRVHFTKDATAGLIALSEKI